MSLTDSYSTCSYILCITTSSEGLMHGPLAIHQPLPSQCPRVCRCTHRPSSQIGWKKNWKSIPMMGAGLNAAFWALKIHWDAVDAAEGSQCRSLLFIHYTIYIYLYSLWCFRKSFRGAFATTLPAFAQWTFGRTAFAELSPYLGSL